MGHLSPRDVVPALRSDLNINRPPVGAGAEVIKVTPADSDTPFAMRGFELSIARMLDGRRTVEEVMTNCERIGLPMDLRAFEGLLHQLETHGLIADGEHPGVGQRSPVRRARASWPPEVRELYRTSLRHAREGNLDAALRDLDGLLELAPGTFEAIALKDWIDKQRAGQTVAIPFQSLLRAAEDTWRSEAIPETESLPLTRPRRPRPQLLPFAVLLAGVAVAAIAVFVPLPRIALASARLSPVAEQTLVAGREATVDDVLVKEGAEVARGEELLVFNVEDTEIRLAEAKDELEQARAPLREVLGRSAEGRPLFAELQAAEAEVARAQAALLEAQKALAGLRFDESTGHLEQRFARAIARRDEARRALDALLPPEAPEAMELEPKVLEIEMLQGQLKDPWLRAPAAGVVRDLNVLPGQYVTPESRLLRLEDTSTLEVVATVTPRVARLARAGEPITLDFNGKPRPAVVERVGQFEIAARLPNPDRSLRPGTYSVNLELKPRSLWDQFRGPPKKTGMPVTTSSFAEAVYRLSRTTMLRPGTP